MNNTTIYNITDIQNIITSFKTDLEVTDTIEVKFNNVLTELGKIIKSHWEYYVNFDIPEIQIQNGFIHSFSSNVTDCNLRIDWREISFSLENNIPLDNWNDVKNPDYFHTYCDYQSYESYDSDSDSDEDYFIGFMNRCDKF